ncbi:MAG: antitoxin VapB family protein [Opitutaceae bacterium]
MPFKTISVDLDAYRALKSAKETERESFSAVIRRVVETPPAADFGGLLKQLDYLAGRGVFTAKERAELRRKQQNPLRSRSRLARSGHAS